jgi:hypothetical protein
MSSIRISELRNSSILRVYSERQLIQTDPEYQRMSGVWTLEKRQLLIDSIINDFDIPKIYFHEFPELKTLEDGRKVKYAIIDGRQRLETIWGFIDGDFSLSNDFIYFTDEKINAKGMTYEDLSRRFPELKTRIDSHTLPIITVVTSDLDMIEEMFLRLNEAVPLNAAEKRNAMGGPMAKVIRDVSNHTFFRKKIPFSNRRYQHREVSAKFLLLTYSKRIGDTKKAYLDNLVLQFKESKLEDEAKDLKISVFNVLKELSKIFIDKDPLLKTQAMTVIYYLVVRNSIDEGWVEKITRENFVQFEKIRDFNKKLAEEDIAKSQYELLEFDSMHLQGSNDGVSIRFRMETLREYLLDRSKFSKVIDQMKRDN